MTLIKSISGIRGTIGGQSGVNLTPIDIVKFASAFGSWINQSNAKHRKKIAVGRDARLSGNMLSSLVCNSLTALGIDVIDLGLSTTPTVEMAVVELQCQGGIILTASHNPKQWNALKLLNSKGEFISEAEGSLIIEYAQNENFTFSDVNNLGNITKRDDLLDFHISKILALPYVDKQAVKDANFKIVVDAVNSVGGFAVPRLLAELGITQIEKLFCEPTGEFAHNPEPLPENLLELSSAVKKHKANLGISVDPDVDRLALVCEDGEMFGEEYTLVTVSDYVLSLKLGNTVSNLSSSRALQDVTEKHGAKHFSSAVGEVNVVKLMKETEAVIGGEGNGGIILPELHYGRDALVGIAIFLTQLAKSKKTCSVLRSSYPNYFISKNKIELTKETDVDFIISKIQSKYHKQPLNTIDGLKIEFDKEWVHLRKSNTEPIIRIYAESKLEITADNLAKKIINDIKEIIKETR